MHQQSAVFCAVVGLAVAGCQSGTKVSSLFPSSGKPSVNAPSSMQSLMANSPSRAGHRAGGLGNAAAPEIAGWLQDADRAEQQGRNDEARLLYQKVLAKHSSHPEAHHRLAIIADREGKYSIAEAHYQMALQTQPNNADVLSDLGFSYFLQGRALEAERHLRQALDVNPKHPHAKDNLALLFDYAKAQQVLISMQPARMVPLTLSALFPSGVPVDSTQRGANALAARRSAAGPQRHMAASPRQPQPSRASNAPREKPPGMSNMEWLSLMMKEAKQESRMRREIKQGRRLTVPPPHDRQSVTAVDRRESYPPGQRLSEADRLRAMLKQVDAEENGMSNRILQASATRRTGPPASRGMRDESTSGEREPRGAQRGDRRPSVTANATQADAPQWDHLPPQHWPDIVPRYSAEEETERAAIAAYRRRQEIQQADYEESPSASRRAAEIGMEAGGGLLPRMEGNARRDARGNGFELGAPVPYHDDGPRYSEYPNGTNSGYRDQSRSMDGEASYQDMIRRHQQQLEADRRALASPHDAGWGGGQRPSRNRLAPPPQEQLWPSYGPDQYDTRGMERNDNLRTRAN